MGDQFDQEDPFAKYGGSEVKQQEDPFKKYGGSAIADTAKKKVSSTDGGNWYGNGGTNGNGVGRLGGSVQKNSIGSAAINKVQIESPSEYISKFEEKTGYKPLSLGSDLPQIAKRREEKKYLQYQSIDENEINPVKLGVASGTISPKELKALYEKPYGKKVVADIINSELPGLEINDLEPNDMGSNEDKFGEIAKELQVKNRQQGIDAQNQSEFNLDNELSNTLSGSTYGADRVGVRGGGEAFAERKENDFGNINTSSASELADALRKISGSTKVWDAEGKEINKKVLSKKINNRIFQLKAGEDIHPEISQESDLISSVVDAMPVEYKRQGGSANNERDAEYIMSGLNFIKDTRPGEYKAIMSTMKVTGKMPETTYTELANIGRDVKFYKDFKSGEYVEQDDRSFITPQLKKANLAGWLSEDLARKGFRNRFAFTQKEILESYKNAPDELKDDELVADIIKAERAPSFGFIPIPQGEGIAKKGVLNSAMRGMATPIGDILNSVDVGFTSSYKSPFDAYLKSKELDRGNQTIINKKGDFTKTLDDNFWNKGVEGFFNLMTQAAIARGIGNVTKLPLNAAIGRIDPRAAITANQAALSIGTPLSTMAQTFGGEYMDFLEKTGSPTKATFGALVSGLAQGQIERFVMPDVKLVDDLNLLTTRRNFAKEIINVIDNGGGRKGVADVVKDYVGNVTKIIGKEAWLEEGAQNFTNYLTEQIISPETAQDRDLLKETIDTGLAATAQMGLFSLFGAAGQTKMQKGLGKAGLNSIAANSEQFIDALGNQLAKGEISQPDYDLATQIINKHRENNLNAPKRDANGKLISPERQLEYAYQSTVADIAEQQAGKISDKIQREPFEKKIAEADKIRRQIFYGEEINGLPKKEEDIKPDGISDQQLFDSVLSKADKGYKATLSVAENAQDGLDYIEDKFAENPVKFREDFGDEIADQILERTSTDKLKSAIDYLINNNPNDPAIPVLDKLIAQREQAENPPIDQVREMADENTLDEVVSESVAGSGGVANQKEVEADIENRVVITGTDGGFRVVDAANSKNKGGGTTIDVRRRDSDDKYEITYEDGTTRENIFSDMEYGKNKDSYSYRVKDKKTGEVFYVVGASNRAKGSDLDHERNGTLFASVKDDGNLPTNIRTILERKLIKQFEEQAKKRPNVFAPLPQSFIDKVNAKYEAESKAVEQSLKETTKAETPTPKGNTSNVVEAGSVGVGGDVGSTTNVLNETQKSNPTVWQKIKDAFNNLVSKTKEYLNKAKGTQYEELAKVLGDHLKNVRTSTIEDLKGVLGEKIGGQLQKLHILVNSGKGDLQTFFHEAMHHITFEKISQYLNNNHENLKPHEIDAIQNLQRIFTDSKAKIEAMKVKTSFHYGFTNLHEFISEAFSNPEFQRLLKELPSEGKHPTVFKAFLDAIAKLMGLKDATILNDIFHHTEKLLDKPKSENEGIAELYHQAKAEGTHPDFVKAVEQSLKEQPTQSSKVTEGGKGETAQSRAKKVYKDIGEIDEPSDARGAALAYLAGGGKIGEQSFNDEVAGTVQRARLNTGERDKKSSEAKARDYVTKDGKSIDDIAHSIWEGLPEQVRETVTTQDIRNELIDAANSHNTRLSAAMEFRDRYITKDVRDNLTEAEAKSVNDADIARRSKIVEELPENQQNELIELLAKYENEYGIVDWERLEKDSNGFSPDILSLSNETQKSLDAIIEKNISQAASKSNNATDKDGGGKEKAEERLTTAQSNYNKAAAELKKAEDKISQTQATQSGMFDATQKEMFGVDRTSAKEILDPLRKKAKEAKAELEDAQKAFDNANEPTKKLFNETTQATTKGNESKSTEKESDTNERVVEDKQATKQKELADKVRQLKINLGKLSGGGMQSNVLGLPAAVWNGSMEVVAKAIEAGGNAVDAIKKGLKYIQANHRGQWDKKGFNEQVMKELGVRGITVNGEDFIIKNDAKTEREFAQTVNGWYSDLEQSVLDVKGEKGSGESWQKVLGKSDEAKWTGLNDWLFQQKGQVSKKDILNYLKDNRIEIVEVEKTDNLTDSADEADAMGEYSGGIGDAKFSQYQIEGEKSNYKEILITLPVSAKDSRGWQDYRDEMHQKGLTRHEADEVRRYLLGAPAEGIDLAAVKKAKNKMGEDFFKSYKSVLNDKERRPVKEKQFQSSHFKEPNILVHLRMNTRKDAEGKKVLFLEEVQSDWGQKGKKEGFDSEKNDYKEIADRFAKGLGFTQGSEADVKLALKRIKQKSNIWEREYAAFKEAGFSDAEINKMAADYTDGQTPSAPFVTETPSWTKLGLKVALKEAVKQGADKIAWSTGTQQFNRWGSEEIHWKKREQPNTKWFINKNDAHPRPYEVHYKDKMGTGMVERYSTYEQAQKGLSEYENRWVLSVNEQKDGATAFAGNEEALRNSRLSEADLVITNKEELRNAIKRNLARERNDAEIDKLTNRVWDRMQKEESGTSLPRKEGMEAFYGSPSEGKLGIVGNVAKSLFKQEPKTVTIKGGKGSIDATSVDAIWVEDNGKVLPENKREDYKFNDNEFVFTIDNNVAYRLYDKNDIRDAKNREVYTIPRGEIFIQHSIDITPELKAEVEGGLPLFKDIKGRGKEIADLLRKGKIKQSGLQSNIAGIPIAIYNGAIEVIARALEKGATLTQAINEAYKKLKLKERKGFKQDEFIQKLEEATGEKFIDEESGKEPPKPPKEPTVTGGEGDSKGGKDKGILNSLYKAKNIPEAARKGFEEEGLKYETKSQDEAQKVAKAFIEEVGIDEAVAAAEAMKFDGDVNSLIFAEALNQLAEQEKAAKTPEEKIEAAKRFAEVGITYDKMARFGGRFNAAINYFYKKSPLGIVMMENAKRQDDFKQWSKQKNQSWKEFYEEMMKEPDFEAVAKQKMQDELKTERAKGRKARIEKVRGVFKAAKDKFKKEGGGTYGTIIPPHIIETVLEAMELAYESGEAVTKIVQDAIDSISNKVGAMVAWDKEKFRKEWEAELKESGGKKTLTDEEIKQKVLEKFRKKLKGLTDKQKDELVSKAYKKIVENGGLDYDDFRKLIAQVTGRADLTDAEAAQMKDLVAKTNAVEDAAEKVRTERTPESFTQLRAAEIEAGRASKELSSLFYNKPDIIKRLTSIMQLSTLGIPALVNNPIYNIWNQATLRFPIGIVNTLIDAGISKVAKLFGREYDREYNIVAGQAEFFNKLGLGTRESFTQLFTGLSRMDYTAKEVDGHQIRPARSLRDLWKFHTGKKPLTKEQYIDKLIQGTIGIPAEVVARILNLGDKPQRFAAEGSQAAAFAKALGLKDMDYRIFVEFPREEAYRAYKAQGLSDEAAGQKADGIKESILQEGKRSTFQQDNLLNDAITRAAGVLGGKDSGTANLAKTLAISPYIKIPTNAFWSLYNLINPEVAILQSGIHAANAKRLKNKNELTKAKLQNREARYWMAHAIVGIGMRAAVIAMVKAGTFVPSSDEDDSKKERDANALFDRPGYVNINGMKISNRWFAQWGMMGNAIAKKWQDATPEQREAQDEFWNIAFGGMELEALGELENGVFANSSAIFQAISQKDFSRYGISTLNMMANILQPASIAQINRAALDEVPNSKGDTFLDRLNQSFAQRSTLYRELFNVQLRQKRDMWGNTMPKGGNILSRMFGISKANPQLAGRPMYNDAIRTSDSGFFPPAVQPNLNGQKLNVEQEDRLIQYIGNEREKLVMPFVSDKAVIDGWNSTYSELKNPDGTSDDETKKYVLSRFYDIGRINGTELFYKDYPEFRPKEQPIDYAEQVKKEIFNSLLSIQKYRK